MTHRAPDVRSARLLLFIAYCGFVSLGLPDTLIGVAWPSVRDAFDRQQGDIAWIFIGTSITYFLSSFFTGRLLTKMGIGLLLSGSCLLVAAGGYGYASAPLWGWFVACALLHGLGSGAIDAGLNHYVAHHYSPRHMNWLHACYSIGATAGPLIMTSTLLHNGSWRAGYLMVASILLLLGLLFVITRRRWNDPVEEVEATGTQVTATMREALVKPVVWLQMLVFLCYTGLEATAGQWSYTTLTESRGVATDIAGLWVTFYWASLALGRVAFGFIVEHIGIDRLLRLSMVSAFMGTLAFAANIHPIVSAAALAVTGLGLAPIFPCLMARTPARVGKAIASHAIGFQVSAAMLGVAALPSASGLLAQWHGLEMVPLCMLAMAATVLALHEVLLRGSAQKTS